MSANLKKIFIGGTGRSGTTLLYKCLGRNPDIYILPKNSESRFIIDHDGIQDLIENLTVKYDIGKPTESLRRFKALMTVYLTHPHDAPYFGKDFASWFGKEYYHNRVNEFIDDLILNKFTGSDLETHNSKSKGKLLKAARVLQDYIHKVRFGHSKSISLPVVFPDHYTVKYFPNRDILVRKSAELIDDIFSYGAKGEDKKTWCEKTPSNLMHIPFIKELFPDSLFVHIIRDPRATIASMMKIPWAPNNVHDTAIFLKEAYKRWFEIKRDKVKLGDFMEVKLEDFVQSPDKILAEIYSRAGVMAVHSNLPPMSLDRINGWKTSLSQDEIEEINEILKDEMKELGYNPNER